ncbi:11620_t:CDS:2, partial [Ambispora leptoticha]
LEVHQTNGEEERESGTSTMSTIQIAVNDALSPSETVMDKRSDLEAHRNIGKGKQAGTSPLHNFPSTIQERSNHLSNHQWRADTNGNKDTRSHDYNSYSVGRPLMFIHHEPEEEVPEQEVQ